jgi:hypothetical protein
MKPVFWKLLLLLSLAACDSNHIFVRVDRLAPGGGGKGGGGAGVYVDQDLCILVHLEADATGFQPNTLFRLFVDGVDRVDETVIGGVYALLTISPAPMAASLDVELFLHNTTFADSFTYNTMPQPPATTLTGVNMSSAMIGDQVTLQGTGFAGAVQRVFFGGVEATTINGVAATSITVTVPAGAAPGLIYVLVDGVASEGLVDFQPLDGSGNPVPAPGGNRIHAVFPAQGVIERPLRVYGTGFDNTNVTRVNDRNGARIFDVQPQTFPTVGDLLRCVGVVPLNTPIGPGQIVLRSSSADTNALPFTVN